MTRYPLAWPPGWKRTDPAQRTRAKFAKGERKYGTDNNSSWMRYRDVTVADATSRLLEELRRLGVLEGDSIISTNLQVRLDGLPRSDQRDPADPGVAVYWQRPSEAPKCMATDRYDRVADNIAALAATVEAMRAIERHGGAQILERAFTGFDALPAPGQTSGKGWREILGFEPASKPAYAEIERAYRTMRGQHHPDRPGGSTEMFTLVQQAWEIAQQEIPA